MNSALRSAPRSIDATPDAMRRCTRLVTGGEADSTGKGRIGAFGNGSSAVASLLRRVWLDAAAGAAAGGADAAGGCLTGGAAAAGCFAGGAAAAGCFRGASAAGWGFAGGDAGVGAVRAGIATVAV